MTANNDLEISGNISRNPVAELILEITQHNLSGSLRISNTDQKVIVYFDKGDIVFAVSNIRKHRLFEILLNQNQISKEKLIQIDNFTNDFYLAKELVEKNIYSKANVDILFSFQIMKILKNIILWDNGEWSFSTLARIKEGIRFNVDISPVFYEFSKNITAQKILERFKNTNEKFALNSKKDLTSVNFSPQQAFIVSRMGNISLSIDELETMCGLPVNDIKRFLYELWLGCFVFRENWYSAFSQEDIAKMNSTEYTLKKSATSVEAEQKRAEEAKILEEAKRVEEEARIKVEKAETEKQETKALQLSLEDYISRIDKAATHYEMFDVEPDAQVSEIKKSYFSLAKKFHPDLYHKTVDKEIHNKIQNAFTEIAHAYETLKDPESREIYDFKLRKVIEKLKSESDLESSDLTRDQVETVDQKAMALENFKKGYDHLMNENYYEALPFFGRAVHLENDNARYHAFYGKALSFDKSQRHKAESELQTAVKLDEENTTYRIMLAELFIEIGLTVRARGELNRLLKIEPENKEAKSLLDSFDNK